MNATRLLKLADFLDQLPRQKFDFARIAHEGHKSMRDALKAGKHRCGTVACAIGWTPVVFPRLVRWVTLNIGSRDLDVCLRSDDDSIDFDAAAQIFDIEYDDACFLFDPGDSRLGDGATPKQVAKHIRKFVKRGGQPTDA